LRREEVGEAAPEGGGADRCDDEWCAEQPLARTQDEGVNDKAVLIDHAGVDHRSGKPCLAVSE